MHWQSFSRTVLIVAALTVGGCSISKWTVKPHQRELLADRIMQLAQCPVFVVK